MRACSDFKQLIPFQKQGQEWRRSAFLVIAKKAIYKDSIKYCSIPKETGRELHVKTQWQSWLRIVFSYSVQSLKLKYIIIFQEEEKLPYPSFLWNDAALGKQNQKGEVKPC